MLYLFGWEDGFCDLNKYLGTLFFLSLRGDQLGCIGLVGCVISLIGSRSIGMGFDLLGCVFF